VFQHPDAGIVQPVLKGLIDSYLKKHAEVHQSRRTSDDFLTQQTDQLRSRLAQTDQELRKARNKAGVISLDDTKKAYTEQIAKIRQDLFAAEADLAERRAALQEVQRLSPAVAERQTRRRKCGRIRWTNTSVSVPASTCCGEGSRNS